MHAVENGAHADGLALHDEVGEQQGIGLLLAGLHVGRLEHGETFVGSKEDLVAAGVESYAIEVFAVAQSVAVDVSDELPCAIVVLPDAHGGRAPEVAVVGFGDVADGLVAQLFTMRERLHGALLVVVEVESLLGADGDVVVAEFTEGEAHHAVEQLVPLVGTEVVGFRIIAGHTRGGGKPDESLPVGDHIHDPVVAEEAAYGVAIGNAVVEQDSCLRIIDAESTRESGEVKIAVGIDSHIVELVTLEADLALRLTSEWVVGEKSIVGAEPILFLRVAVDEFHGGRCCGMGHDVPLCIEAIDAYALHSAPGDAVVAWTDR